MRRYSVKKEIWKITSSRNPANLDGTHIDLALLKQCSQLSIFSSGFKIEPIELNSSKINTEKALKAGNSNFVFENSRYFFVRNQRCGF